jgi:integrase
MELFGDQFRDQKVIWPLGYAAGMSPSVQTALPASGHVFRRAGKARTVWVAKWRDDAGQHKRVLGRAWDEKGPPPAGHLRAKDADAALHAILTDARRGQIEQARTGLTFAALAQEWLAFGIRERDWKPSTLSDNRSSLNAYLLPEFGQRQIEKIDADRIEHWRNSLLEDRDLSRRTVNKLHVVLGAVLERACAVHGLASNPAREVKKLRERYDPNVYDFFSPDEIAELIKAAASDQDAAIFCFAAFTGLRLGELLALRWRDVDFDRLVVRVYGSYSLGTLTAPKSGLSRAVPMADQVAETLQSLKRRPDRTGRDDLVFPGERGEYLDGSALRRRYKRALEDAGLRALRFHDLRHTFGSIAIDRATIVQVQAWMGHADVQTTMKYMHHRSREGDAALLSDAFRPTPKPRRRPGGPCRRGPRTTQPAEGSHGR